MNNMVNPNSSVKHSFVMETFKSFRGRSLKSIKPDKDGYYNGVPVAVVGVPSDNKAYYDPASFLAAMNRDPFKRKLTMGGLGGEVQHPDLPDGKLTIEHLKRLHKIDQTLQAVHFEKVYLAEKLENGGRIVRVNMKPHGPYGQYTEEKLNDKRMGYAASLRAAVSETFDRSTGLKMRTIGTMVTFDNADSGGYLEASKYYISGTEEIEMNLNDYYIHDKESGEIVAACEEIKDMGMLEAFGVKEMIYETKKVGILLTPETYVDNSGINRSTLHHMIKKSRR